jgi:hypothetical protein
MHSSRPTDRERSRLQGVAAPARSILVLLELLVLLEPGSIHFLTASLTWQLARLVTSVMPTKMWA